jgi:hypothetical protein
MSRIKKELNEKVEELRINMLLQSKKWIEETNGFIESQTKQLISSVIEIAVGVFIDNYNIEEEDIQELKEKINIAANKCKFDTQCKYSSPQKPEFGKRGQLVKKDVKGITPLSLFKKENIPKIQEKNPSLTVKEISDLVRKEWLIVKKNTNMYAEYKHRAALLDKLTNKGKSDKPKKLRGKNAFHMFTEYTRNKINRKTENGVLPSDKEIREIIKTKWGKLKEKAERNDSKALKSIQKFKDLAKNSLSQLHIQKENDENKKNEDDVEDEVEENDDEEDVEEEDVEEEDVEEEESDEE